MAHDGCTAHVPKGSPSIKEFLEEFWDVRLDALKREAEKEERKKHGRRN